MSFFRNLQNKLLDASIFFSFDRSGFLRHAQEYNTEDLNVDCTGKNYLITGANSGLGKATATEIAQRGGTIYLLCRNEQRAANAQEEIIQKTKNENVHIELIDMSDLHSVEAAVERLQKIQIDVLINNAGVLPTERWESKQGYEGTFATNILGAQLLTKRLYPVLASNPQSRIIWVTSGGMYPTRLSLSRLINPKEPFDGVQAYSQTKRAQVILNRLWAQYGSVPSYCMHPGWAATPGVQQSLPKFDQMMEGRLRTSLQGADTIIWLAISKSLHTEQSGTLWFDRCIVAENFFPWTASSEEQEQKLWDTLEEMMEQGLSKN